MGTRLLLKYLCYFLLVFALVCLRGYVSNLFNSDLEMNYRFNLGYLSFMLVINVCIGLILGIEHLAREINIDGYWRFNWIKVLLMGLPSLFFSLYYFMLLGINNVVVQNILDFMLHGLFGGSIEFTGVFQIILGFVLITSFYKKSDYISLHTRKQWGIYNEY